MVVFWFVLCACRNDAAYRQGGAGGLAFVGNLVYSFTVVTVSGKALLETTSWTAMTHLAVWGSIFVWFLFLAVYSHLWVRTEKNTEKIVLSYHPPSHKQGSERSKQTSERVSGARKRSEQGGAPEQVSGASERANGRGSGPEFTVLGF